MSKYSLQLTLENGKTIDAGEIEVHDGVDGKDGLTTSVNGVEQVDGNVQLTPEHIGACPENENIVECTDGVLRTLAGASVGISRIATGSYKPTESVNGYSLTFDFEPQVLMIFKAGAKNVPIEISSQNHREDRGITFIKGCTTYPTYARFGPIDGGYYYSVVGITVEFNGNTVSWSTPDTANITDSDGWLEPNTPAAGGEGAFCAMNKTYHYVAIG